MRHPNSAPSLSRTLPFTFAAAIACFAATAPAQSLNYSGKVVDEAGKGIAGAKLEVKSEALSAFTGSDGSFSLVSKVTGLSPRSPRQAAPGPSVALGAGNPGLGGRSADGRFKPSLGWTPAYASLRSAQAGADQPLAKAAALANAAYILDVTMAGYQPGSFPQSNATATNLSLKLIKVPSPSGPAGAYAKEKAQCMDEINVFRSTKGLKALVWDKTLEAFADEGAKYDSQTGIPHSHFSRVEPNPAWAENELPGWSLQSFGPLAKIVTDGNRDMWNEGPGGGHYENMVGNYSKFGCGIYVTPAGNVWLVQNFR